MGNVTQRVGFSPSRRIDMDLVLLKLRRATITGLDLALILSAAVGLLMLSATGMLASYLVVGTAAVGATVVFVLRARRGAARQGEQRELPTQLDEFPEVFALAPDPLVITDRLGRIVMMNPAATDLFGYQLAEV